MNVLLAAVMAGCAVLAWPAHALVVPAPRRERGGATRRLRRSHPEAECLRVLDALVTVLRAGSAVGPALVMAIDGAIDPASAGATASGWRRLRAEAAADGDVAAIWRDLGREWRSGAFDEVASAWQLSARHGCPLADAMEGAARSVRARRAHQACVDGATAGAKASTSVLLGLPVLGVCLGLTLGVDMLGCYRGLSGFVTLWPGLVLMAAGAAWARRMTASALRPPRQAGAS